MAGKALAALTVCALIASPALGMTNLQNFNEANALAPCFRAYTLAMVVANQLNHPDEAFTLFKLLDKFTQNLEHQMEALALIFHYVAMSAPFREKVYKVFVDGCLKDLDKAIGKFPIRIRKEIKRELKQRRERETETPTPSE